MIKRNKKMIRGKSHHPKWKCDGCGEMVRVRHLIYFKGKYLCANCQQKHPSYKEMQRAVQIGRPFISLKKALNKTYKIKTYDYGGILKCLIFVPSILAFRKVKLKLIKEE